MTVCAMQVVMTKRLSPAVIALLLAMGCGPAPGETLPRPPSAARSGVTSSVDALLRAMALDRKIGQLLLVQFTGPAFSADIAAMVRSHQVGGVIFYASNGNIHDADQLRGVIDQLKRASAIPLLIAIDQEGGYVDRLVKLNGRRPSAATIAETSDPATAEAVGAQDARDLSALGFNLNLAPVVDVARVSNPQLEDRTFGDDPKDVTRLAGAYLRGLQQGGSVFGALKHFPGLGGVRIDPHQDMPVATQTREQLEAVDWPPYRALIASRDAHAVMVTHEVVRALDPSLPATLSQRMISGVLRGEMNFDGVVITDSLSMEGITASYPQPQAAVMAIRAGADLVMGAARPREVAEIAASFRRAIAAGTIKEAQIDLAARRVLTMKAALGLLPPSAGK